MKPMMIAVACSAAMLAGALPAHAQTSSSNVLSNLRYTLVDLDPTDGIAPKLSIYDDGFPTGHTDAVDTQLSLSDDKDSFHTLGPLASAVGGGTASYAAASISGALSTAPITLSAQAGQDAPFSGSVGLTEIYSQFRLSAHTQLILEGDDVITTTLAASDPFQTADAYAFASIYAPGQEVSWGSDSGSESFRLTLSNASGTSESAEIDLGIDATAANKLPVTAIFLPPTAQDAPVPEPAQDLLLAVGLGALALARRYRRR